jgi:hypothetical protein
LIAQPVAVSADVVVVPNSVAAVEGNSNVAAGGNLRVQQVHDASQFSGLGSIQITGVAFRLDANSGAFGPDTLPGLQVRVSTTSRAPDGLSTTFATNVGPDVTTVFSGDWTRSSTSAPGPGGTNVFDILLPFTTPFTYDPAGGNLLVDYIGNPAGSLLLLFPSQTDTHDVVGDSVSNIVAEPASSPTGITVGSFGVVTQFTFVPTAIPEPTNCVLLGLGLIGFLAWRQQVGWKRPRSSGSFR